MTLIKKRIIQAFFILCGVGCGNLAIYSCTCELSSTRKSFKRSKFVFIGKAIDVQGNSVRFDIVKVWKGPVQKEIIVDAEPNAFTGDCGDGFAFEREEKYVVFIDNDELMTGNSCTPNFHVTPVPQSQKYDKSTEYQKTILGKLNSSLFRFWANMNPF